MAKIGNIEIFNETEEKQSSVTVTQYDIEKGEPFTDHVRRDVEKFTVTGYILTDDWKTVQQQLEKAMYAGKIMKYVGKMSASNVVITSVRVSQSEKIANGGDLTMNLQKIKITKSSHLVVKKKKSIPKRKKTSNSGKKKQTGKRKSQEVVLIIKKGDTYWGYSQKYGTPIPTLRKWNGYKDRFLPIGGKIRVK